MEEQEVTRCRRRWRRRQVGQNRRKEKKGQEEGQGILICGQSARRQEHSSTLQRREGREGGEMSEKWNRRERT